MAADFTLPGGGTPPVSDDFNRPDSPVLYTTPRALSIASGLIATPLVSGDAVTVTFNQATSRRVATALEFSGILTTGRLDQITQIKSGTGTALSTNTTGTTGQADEFLVGGFAADNASVFTPGAGYTTITSGSAGTSSIVGLHGEWKLISTVGAYDATSTKATTGCWTSGLVSYGIPLAYSVTGGNRNDVTQLIPLLDRVPPVRGTVGRPRQRPDTVVADRGYDHDKYRRLVRARGITPVIARRKTEHGSGLGQVRWVVERTFAWLHHFKRLLVRYDRRHEIHEAFLAIGCCLVCYRRLANSF